jgi:tetratricopeptide (TPR) repeat protein
VAGAHDAGDSLGYEALIFALMASLEREERRLPEAAALLDRALRAEADRPLRASILFNQAAVVDELGRSEEAIRLLREAEALVDPEQSPRLVRVSRHNLLVFLTNAGRHDEARRLLPEVQRLSRESGEALDLLRCLWAEARLRAEDDPEAAGRLFEEVRREFLAREMHYDFALASIELALLYARAHRLDEVRRIATAILPVFEAADVHREALAAVTLFVSAVESDAKDALLFSRLADYLRKARHNPSLRFEESGASAGEAEE